MLSLKEIMNLYYPVPDALVEKMQSFCETVTVRKGDLLVEQGHRVHHFYFLQKGLIRMGYVSNGRETTVGFGVEGDIFTSLHSYFAREINQFSVEALAPVRALKIPFGDFDRLVDENPELMKWMNRLLIEQVFALERRYVHLSNSDAISRYRTLMTIRASIINQIPIKYIAQYLDVTPETMSRIRRKIKENS